MGKFLVGIGLIGWMGIVKAAPINSAIVSSTYPLFYPSIAKDGKGDIYLAFELERTAQDYDAVLYKSTDGGQKWNAIWTYLYQKPTNNRRPSIGIESGGTMYFMAEGGLGGDLDDFFWFARFENGLYKGTMYIGDTPWYKDCSHPQVGFLSQGAWLVWEDNSIADNPDIKGSFAMKDTNVVYQPIDVVSGPSVDRYPFVAPLGLLNSVIVVYEHLGGDWDINGISLTPPQGVGMPIAIATEPVDETQPYVSVSGSYVYVAYNRGDDIWLAYSTDGGSTFENAEVSAEPEKERWPAVAAQGKIVDVAYWSEDGNIYERCSNDNGQTFSKPALITSKATALDTPRLAMIMGKEKPCIVWVDNRKGHPLLYSAIGYKTSSEFPTGETEKMGEPTATLLRVYPKFFNTRTEIEYSLSQDGRVNLSVYELTGKRVLTLIDRKESPGIHRLVWDGRDSKGVKLPSGVYFISLETDHHIYIQRAVLIR